MPLNNDATESATKARAISRIYNETKNYEFDKKFLYPINPSMIPACGGGLL